MSLEFVLGILTLVTTICAAAFWLARLQAQANQNKEGVAALNTKLSRFEDKFERDYQKVYEAIASLRTEMNTNLHTLQDTLTKIMLKLGRMDSKDD